MVDSLYFKPPIAWAQGEYEDTYNQLREFVDGDVITWWFAKGATVSTPVLMTTNPATDPNWTLWSAVTLNAATYETQKRLAAEAGFNMVGSFLLGATVTTTIDVVFYESDGKYYSWSGSFQKVVPAGSTPATSGGVGAGAWVDRTDHTLRSQLLGDSGTDSVKFKLSGVATATQKSITDFLLQTFVHVDWCGAVGDGVTDDWQAIRNAIDLAFYLNINAVKFSQKTYYSSKCFSLKEIVTLFSDTGFQVGKSKAVIKFADNTCGIVVHRSDTNCDDYGYSQIKEALPTSGGADGSIIRGLSLIRGNGADTNIDGLTHCIRLRARASVENCYISGFAGDGLHIYATSSTSDNELYGNANNWGSRDCRITNCRDGVFVDGADVNVGNSYHLDCSSNQRYGIYDSSFLGCTWVGCHCNGNAVLDILHDNANAPSVFVGQYVESGGACNIVRPARVIGGQFSGVTMSGNYYSDTKMPGFTTEKIDLTSATTGTGYYATVWNQGSISSARYSGISFKVGTTVTNMIVGAVRGRPTASNNTNRSAIGFQIYNGSLGAYEQAFEAHGGHNAMEPGTDNVWSLGYSSLRFTTVYATTAAINTSDERLKTFIDVEEAERLAALAIKAVIKKFKFNDSIESKGLENARLHFGVGAQTVKAILESHGLIAESYGFFCFDQWNDEYEDVVDADGDIVGQKLIRAAGDRYGIRYEELAMFILSAV
jgi:hypothetical protein